MVKFCDECGADMYICQVCGRDLCSVLHPAVWNEEATGNKHAGNVCPECYHNYIKGKNMG